MFLDYVEVELLNTISALNDVVTSDGFLFLVVCWNKMCRFCLRIDGWLQWNWRIKRRDVGIPFFIAILFRHGYVLS